MSGGLWNGTEDFFGFCLAVASLFLHLFNFFLASKEQFIYGSFLRIHVGYCEVGRIWTTIVVSTHTSFA